MVVVMEQRFEPLQYTIASPNLGPGSPHEPVCAACGFCPSRAPLVPHFSPLCLKQSHLILPVIGL